MLVNRYELGEFDLAEQDIDDIVAFMRTLKDVYRGQWS